MRKSRIILALLLCCAILQSAFSAGRKDAASRSDEKVKLTMWTFLDIKKTSPREVALKKMIDNFHAQNPNIEVVVESQVWNTMPTKFFMAHSTGNAPDLCWINTENLGALVKTEAGADLNGLFINKMAKEDEGDFFIRAGWDATLIDGKRYSVPLFHSSQSLLYRKDLFLQAGIDPSSLKTWDQFMQAMKKLTADTNKDGIVDIWGFGFPLSIEKPDTNPFLYSLLELNDSKAFDNCKPLYANPAGVKSLKLQAGFIQEGVTPKESLAYSSDDVVDQFMSGKYAVIVGPFVRFTQIQKGANWDKNNLAIMQWPNWTPDRYGPVTVKGWWIAAWAKSKNVSAAGKFIAHMIGKESVRLWAVEGGQVPTRLSVMQDPFFNGPQFDYMREIVKGWQGWSWLNPVSCNMSGYEGDISAATHKYLLENADPMTVLKEAEKKFIERQ